MATPITIKDFVSEHLFDYMNVAYDSLNNECTAQLLIHRNSSYVSFIIDFLKNVNPDTVYKSSLKSDQYREQGNRLFRSHKAIEASRFYTDAILAAPFEGGKSLPLAHANRSAALAVFGYYKEAYEDCECAVEYGYPDENMQKIIVRQANCAYKLKDFGKLEYCLAKLREMELSSPFANQKAELEEALIRLKEEETSAGEQPQCPSDNILQNILIHPSKGVYMAASKNVGKGEEIFTDTVFSFVPWSGNNICSSCASQNIIPFPCNVCSKVYYCSLKCRKAGKMVHQFECNAQRYGLFNENLSGLPLNTLLNGLPSIVPSLRECKSMMEIWRKIDTIAKSGDKGYAEVLRVTTDLRLIEPEKLFTSSIKAAAVAIHLKRCTAFFTLFKGSQCSSFDWSMVVSALILRHFIQITPRTTYGFSLICSVDSGFPALSSMWDQPHHLKKGMLHKFSVVDFNYTGIFPYLSICKHSCIPSLIPKFDGNRAIGIALRALKRDEIYTSCVADYRQQHKSHRHKIQKINNAMYKCQICSPNDDDDEYLKFNKYRCQNSICKATFTPTIDSLYWYTNVLQTTPTCPVCKVQLEVDWFWNFHIMSTDPSQVRSVLNIFYSAGQILEGLHVLRQLMASTAITSVFNARKEGLTFTRDEIKRFEEILNYSLSVIEHQFDVESLFYVAAATHALDLMAENLCFDFDCKKIQKSLRMLSTELRIVFNNYIDDFLKERFSF